MDQLSSYAGQLLLAMPGIGDQRFEHAVIALCAHDANGALGIAIGDEIAGVTLYELLRSFDIEPQGVADRPVLRGGPVEPQRGFVLHSLDWTGQTMLNVGDRWGLSGSMDILQAIATGQGPSRYLVALGYAGWGAGQLEQEMLHNGWSLATPDPALLFEEAGHAKWSAAFARAGIDSSMLVAGAGSA